MKLIEVNSAVTKKQFLDVAREVYKNDPVWVCPLDIEIESIFDPKSNHFHAHGEQNRWVLLSDDGKLIGRVAAFINHKKAHTFQQPTGGMGFFECVNNKESAFLLFDTCKHWLEERGMLAMDGPINFGENDNFWGLLVEGFTHPGIGMNYNPPYYKEFFEDYGFKMYFQQVSNHLDITKPFPERFAKIANWVAKKEGYRFEHLRLNHLDRFANDFMNIYNDAWQFHENFTPMLKETVMESLDKIKDIVDERFIWFAYVDNDPAAFVVVLPDANQVIKYMNGKTNLWAKLKFIFYKWMGKMDRLRVVIMGVKPQYQKLGLESALIMKLHEIVIPMNHYKEVELSWVGDFNPKMSALHEATGAEKGKIHYTYRCLFSDTLVYNRSTIIERDTKEKALAEKNAVVTK